ncbi:MAG: hypothetical protein LBM67_02310 [Lentimicrobiaceae bacterium]|jgi:hypothetical protein|nr:hypothetical protein [Lentimicrobiaceae bacterium]
MRYLDLKSHIPFLLFLFVFGLFIASLYQRYPQGDEGLIAEHVYHFEKEGYVKSKLGAGYRDDSESLEHRQYFYHKLFVLTGVLFMKLFGFHIYTFKAVSLFFLLVFFLFLYFYFKKFLRLQCWKTFFFVTASLVLFNAHIFDFGFLYRPEIMAMTLGFISFYFLQKGLVDQPNYLWMLISGMFAGLSAFTHLNGVIYPFAGGLLLIFKKEFRSVVFFTITACFFTLLYFFDIHSVEEFNSLWNQFTTDGVVIAKKPFYMSLLKEHQRFFHSIVEISFSVLLLFSLFFNFKYLKNNFNNIMLYLLFLVIGLGLFAHGRAPYYGIHYTPYIALIIAVSCLNIFSQKNKTLKIAQSILLLGFVVVNGVQNEQTIAKKIDIAAHNARLSALIPEKQVKIAAPSVFIFEEISHYESIRSDMAYYTHTDHFHIGEQKTVEGLLRFSCERGDKYILIDKYTTGFSFFKDASKLDLNLNGVIAGCQLIHKSDTYFIFKNLNIR